eukprot:1677359-Amphidinium_carterae.1
MALPLTVTSSQPKTDHSNLAILILTDGHSLKEPTQRCEVFAHRTVWFNHSLATRRGLFNMAGPSAFK